LNDSSETELADENESFTAARNTLGSEHRVTEPWLRPQIVMKAIGEPRPDLGQRREDRDRFFPQSDRQPAGPRRRSRR